MRLIHVLKPRRVAFILMAIAVCLSLVSITAEYVETRLGRDAASAQTQILDLFSVNAEESIPTWYSATLLLLAGGILAVITAVKQSSRDPHTFYWAGLGVIFVYLSIDESAAIHEILSEPLHQAFHTSGLLAFGWQLAAVPLLLIIGLLYLRFLMHLPPRTRGLILLAGALYVGGALVIDALSAANLANSGMMLLYLAIGTVEELCEMLGVSLFIYALLAYMTQMAYVIEVYPAGAASPPGTPTLPPAAALPGFARRIRPAALIILILLATNAALLYKVITGTAPVAPSSAYAALGEAARSAGGTWVQVNGLISVPNGSARQMASLLLCSYDEALVVSFPSRNLSAFFAADSLPFTRDQLVDALRADGESGYILFDTETVQAMTADIPCPPA
jgi:hypothetical protein